MSGMITAGTSRISSGPRRRLSIVVSQLSTTPLAVLLCARSCPLKPIRCANASGIATRVAPVSIRKVTCTPSISPGAR